MLLSDYLVSDIFSLCIPPDAPAVEAMRIINQGNAQIALVVDANTVLLGTLSDGDIRRGLLNGETLDTPVNSLMNPNFRFALTSDSIYEARQLMKDELLFYLPILDNDGCLVHLLSLKDMIREPKISNPVVLMAGGKGQRLRPYTHKCPKPMLLINDKPMLEILLEKYIASGFYNFYFSVNYLKEQIIDHFGNGAKWGVNIQYLCESSPLGTAGSLTLLADSIDEPILVSNGDVLTHLKPDHLLDFHLKHNASATMCVREHEVSVPFGVVQSNDIDLLGFEEKPTYLYNVNAGVYVLDPTLISLLPKDEFTDMPTLLTSAQDAGHRVIVCPIYEYWLDVGKPESLNHAKKTWKSRI